MFFKQLIPVSVHVVWSVVSIIVIEYVAISRAVTWCVSLPSQSTVWWVGKILIRIGDLLKWLICKWLSSFLCNIQFSPFLSCIPCNEGHWFISCNLLSKLKRIIDHLWSQAQEDMCVMGWIVCAKQSTHKLHVTVQIEILKRGLFFIYHWEQDQHLWPLAEGISWILVTYVWEESNKLPHKIFN